MINEAEEELPPSSPLDEPPRDEGTQDNLSSFSWARWSTWPRWGHWIVTITFVAVCGVAETRINGHFFGQNMIRQRGGQATAALISAVNLVALASLAAFVFHRWRISRAQSLVRWGWLTSSIIAFSLTAVFHLGVAHFRDALPPQYPQPPEGTQAASIDPILNTPDSPSYLEDPTELSRCYRDTGTGNFDASAEALCLLVNRPIGLHGFESWVFFMLGVALWGLAFWKYLGLGSRPSAQIGSTATQQSDRFRGSTLAQQMPSRARSRRELVFEAGQRIFDAARRQVSAVRQAGQARLDVTGERLLVMRVGIDRQHRSLRQLTANLTAEGTRGVEAYRRANREARGGAAVPKYWSDRWNPDWSAPGLEPLPAESAIDEYVAIEKEARIVGLARLQELVEETETWNNDAYTAFLRVTGTRPANPPKRWGIEAHDE